MMSSISSPRASVDSVNVLISLILVTLMLEAILTSETSVLTRATRRNIPEDDILPLPIAFIRLCGPPISGQ
jgi:hypothetical protein